MDGLRRDSVPDRGATGVAVVIWCRCNAHLVESDDDQTPDETCCVCRGKRLQAARRRWFLGLYGSKPSMCGSRRKHSLDLQNRHAEKPNAPDCSEAFAAPLTGRGGKAAGRYPTRASIMPDAHRDVKHNTPPRAAGGSDAEHRES